MGMAREWLIRHHRKPRRKNISTSTEFHRTFGTGTGIFQGHDLPQTSRWCSTRRNIPLKNYSHKQGKPKDMGYWWTGSTWFK
eukprot:6996128-Prorocentrum_lima.AAC.1